jgi:A/G-specific adenine glycosylase
MHRAAKDLVENNGGKMPETYKGLLAMKGVGSYTASAIASICFGEKLAVVDGNVARVVARIHGVEEPVNSTAGKRIIDSLASSLMAESMNSGNISPFPDPGTHNQAMMEFGALHCVPSSPDCGVCPLSQGCNAFLTNRVSNFPVKIPKRKAKDRWMYFYILKCEEDIILSRRDGQGIWRSLYLFPMLESSIEQSENEIFHERFQELMTQLSGGVNEGVPSVTAVISGISTPIRHQLTHLTIYARFIHISLSSLPSPLPENFFRIPVGKLEDYPVPRLMERYMESAKI